MDISKCKSVITKILFFILVILSFILILYTFQYNVLLFHDTGYDSYGMPFLKPDHGRYIGSFLNNIFTDIIPSQLNLHPNTFLKFAVNPIKAMLIILFCLILANSFFIFKKEEKDILKFDFGNIAFFFTYIVIFLAIFNSVTYSFLSQNTYFWSNFLCLFYYVIFLNLLSYYLVNPEYCEKSINNRNYIILLIFAFLTGISHEVYNAPILFVLSIYFIYFLFNKNKFSVENIKKVYILCGVYILSLICFYIHPTDNPFIYGTGTYKDYLINEFPKYLQIYFDKFCMHYVIFYTIAILVISILICIKKAEIKNIVFLIFINLISIYLFYLALFFIGYDFTEGLFYLIDSDNKFTNMYNPMSLYLFVLISGYYIDICVKSNQKSLLKSICCLLILIIFSKYLIINYKTNLDTWLFNSKNIKTIRYVAEKIAVTYPGGETIIFPLPFVLPNDMEIAINDGSLCDYDFWILGMKIIHPELAHKENVVYDGDVQIDENLFTEQELEELDFQKLLISRMPKRKYRIWAEGRPRGE